MDKILFIGKRKDNGEWVESRNILQFSDSVYFPMEYGNIEIIPKSVGRYTSLQDNRGKRIFEGHIIKAITPDKTAIGFFKIGIGEVEADGYKVVEVYGEDRNGNRGDMVVGSSECYEIIGNIYDNPELINSTTEEE